MVEEDLDAALRAARGAGVRLILVMLDFLWVARNGPGAFIRGEIPERLVDPLLREFGRSPEILAWEAMNEPDWAVSGLSPDPVKVPAAVPQEAFLRFVLETGRLVHLHTDALYTVGSCRARHLSLWDREDLGLDLLQVHPWADFLGGAEADRIRGRDAGSLGVRKPVLAGEYPLGLPESEGYERILREGGYAGALYWSHHTVDRFGVGRGELQRAALASSRGPGSSGSAIGNGGEAPGEGSPL